MLRETRSCSISTTSIALERAFAEAGAEIAAVIVEPVAGNMNLVAPQPAFLQALREIARAMARC